MLYTSGSTGTPKGIVHSTAGYMIGSYATFKYVFDYKPGEVYWCTADIGWITGHSYIVYGPLLARELLSTLLSHDHVVVVPHQSHDHVSFTCRVRVDSVLC